MSQSWEEKLGLAITPPEESPVEEVQEGTFDLKQAIEAARTSLDFLAAISMPTIFKYFFPKTYHEIWAWLLHHVHKTRDFSQLALGFPRGFAKTTFIKLFILYVILFTQKKFILVIASSYPKAVAIISDVIDFLNEPNIRKLFGNWEMGAETDRQDLKKFGFRGRNIIIAAGTVSTVRGLNIKHERPDVMLFDDIQSREDADSETVSKQIETDMYGTAMKAKSPHGCLFLFVANMYPTKWSLLRRIKSNPTWIKWIAGAILQDGTSLWEDLQPIEQLLKEYQNDLISGRPEIFHAEVLNDENASVNHLIDLSKVPAYPYSPEEIPAGKFIVIDPSNDKTNSDNVAVGYFEILNATPVCMEVTEERMSPGQTIQCALRYALTHNCTLIVVESNAYQFSLLYWFNYVTLQMGIQGIHCVDIYTGNLSKNTRILTMFKELLAGELFVHPQIKAQVHNQITSFNPMKTNNTDNTLDLLTYARRVMTEQAEYLFSECTIEMQEYDAIPVRDMLEASPF